MKMARRIAALILAACLMFSLAACGGSGSGGAKSNIPGLEDGVLTVAMECDYAPYNWAQPTNANGAVPIKDSSLYANGYDVMTAKQICEANGWKLEIVQMDWDSLVPAVQSGLVDAVIAGQSPTAERKEKVDFVGPYLYANIVCLTRQGSPYANAKGLADLAGGTCTSQLGTIWYDSCLTQIPNANIVEPAETAPAMLMALETGVVDYVCTDMPTAQGALVAYPDFTILDFSGSGDDFEVTEEDVNISISIQKGNTALGEAITKVLKDKTAADFNALMAEAVKVQPLSE